MTPEMVRNLLTEPHRQMHSSEKGNIERKEKSEQRLGDWTVYHCSQDGAGPPWSQK